MADVDSHETEVDLRRFLDLSGSLLIVAGFDTRVRLLSPTYARILGFEPERIVGSRFTDFVHPDDLAGVIRHTQTLLDGGKVSQPSTGSARSVARTAAWSRARSAFPRRSSSTR